MERPRPIINEDLSKGEEAKQQPEAVRPAPTRAEIRLAREALSDRLWGPVTKGILADAVANEKTAGGDQPNTP